MTESRFSHLFKVLRLRRGLSMNALARLSGVSASTISRWEAGATKPCLPELEYVLCILNPKEFVRRRLIHSIGAPRTIQTLRQEYAKSGGASQFPAPTAGGFLKALRHRAGFTQGEVASKVGIAQSTLARWERGDHWPSSTELHSLCFVLEAKEGEVTALTCNPQSLAPNHTGRLLNFDEAMAWMIRVHTNSVDQISPDLIELQHWQLIAALWSRYQTWGEPGLELFSEALARFAYVHLDAKPGMLGLPSTARRKQARYFAGQALRIPTSQNSKTSFVSAIVLSYVLAESNSAASIRQAYDIVQPWTTMKISSRRRPDEDEVCPEAAAWALSRLSHLMEQRGWQSAADALSLQAIRTARSYGKSVEARVRINDRAEMLLRGARYEEALDTLQPDDPGGKILNYWESILWAEALRGAGHAEQAIGRIISIQPGLDTKDEAYFLGRAEVIRQQVQSS